MPITSLNDFWQQIAEAKLLSDEEIVETREFVEGAKEASPNNAAAALVQMGKLTRWQAGMLLAGEHRFFLGRYKLLDKLGQGGMGAVFKAEQQPLGRIVALKVMSDRILGDESALVRFRREIRAAAALDHPNIVRAFDADCVGDTHFLVMEYVEGDNLAGLVRRGGPFPVSDACHYACQAARGLAHAHQRGMVHRDIKPSNLLLSDGTVKILDFGLAKLEFESETGTDLTATGQVMGTPDYIAPEQSRNTRAADVRSDLYSLGCTLFYLASGSVPFPRGNTVERLMARIMDDAPRLKSILPEIPDDLDAVVAKLLDRNPEKRFQSSEETLAAIAPFAVPPSRPTTGRHSTGNNAPPSESHTISQFGDAAYRKFLASLSNEASDGSVTETQSRPFGETMSQMDSHSDVSSQATLPGDTVRRRLLSGQRSDRIRLWLWIGGAAVVVMMLVFSAFWFAAGKTRILVDWPLSEREGAALEVDGLPVELPDTAQFELPGDPGTRTLVLFRKGYERVEMSWKLGRGETVDFRPQWRANRETIRRSEWAKLEGSIRAVVAKAAAGDVPLDDPKFQEFASQLSAFVREWPDTKEANAAGELRFHLPWPIDVVDRTKISPENLKLVGNGDPALVPKEIVAVIGDPRRKAAGRINAVAYHPKGTLVATGDQYGWLTLWDPTTGKQVKRWFAGSEHSRGPKDITALAFHPDGQRVLSGTYMSAGLWDIATGKLVRRFDAKTRDGGHTHNVESLAFSRDGRQLVTGHNASIVVLWDVATGKELKRFEGHTDIVKGVAVFRESGLICSCAPQANEDHIIVWDSEAGQPVKKLKFPYCLRVRFSNDGQSLFASGSTSVVRWDLRTWKSSMEFRTSRYISDIQLSQDGRWLCTAVNGVVHVKDLKNSGFYKVTVSSEEPQVALSPDSKTIAVGDEFGRLRFFDVPSLEEKLPTEPSIVLAAVSPNGRALAIATDDNQLKLTEFTGTRVNREFKIKRPTQGPVTAIAFDRDAGRFAASWQDGSLAVWETQTGKLLWKRTAHNSGANAIHFSHDGKSLATSSDDGTGIAKLFDPVDGRLLHEFAGHGRTCSIDGFTPLGDRLVVSNTTASGRNYATVIWNPQSGQRVALLEGIVWQQLSHDGRHLVAVRLKDKRAVIFDVRTGNPRTVLPPVKVRSVRFAGDSRTVIVGTLENTLPKYELYDLLGRIVGTLPAEPSYRAGWRGPNGRYFLGNTGGRRALVVDLKASRTRRPQKARLIILPVSYHDQFFTPDGRHVVTLNVNGTLFVIRIRQWQPPP